MVSVAIRPVTWSIRSRLALYAEVGQAMRFGVVGLTGVAVNSAVLWLLTDRFHVYYLVSSAAATEVAIVSNFVLHHTWTFRARKGAGSHLSTFARFNALALVGLCLTVLTLALATNFLHLHYLIANLIAVGTATAWNYTASRCWAWSGAAAARTGRGDPVSGAP